MVDDAVPARWLRVPLVPHDWDFTVITAAACKSDKKENYTARSKGRRKIPTKKKSLMSYRFISEDFGTAR